MDFSTLCYIDSTGYHFADYPTFLAWVTAQYQSIYGADVILTPDSQDGQWIAVQALYLYQTAAIGASIYNSFSPATAQGLGLSRVVKINGLSRQVASNSTADLTIVGQAGTVLGTTGSPAIAQDTLNQNWIIPIGTTIPGGGSIVVTATAQDIGAINAGAGTITTIYTPTLGWQSVTNVLAAVPGAPVETDAALRVRQTQSTANPSLTVLDGTVGDVENVAGVQYVTAYENDTETTDANSIPPHAICIVAYGGTDADIAAAIQIHKTPGTVTFGNTSVTTTDSRGMPLVINFQRPTTIEIKVQVTLVTSTGWSNDYKALIQNAVAAYVATIGIGAQPIQEVLLSKFYIPAYLIGTAAAGTFDITQILIAKNSGALGSANIVVAFSELPVCNASTDVTVLTS
jgi:uncharacterized phage protein gp47/JayE